MATFYSDIFPIRTSPVVDLGNRQEGFKITPRVSRTWITYTFVGTEEEGDIIRLFQAKAGDIIIPKYSDIYVTVDPAVTLTLDIGDTDTTLDPSADADRYADGINAAAVGLVSFGTAGVAYANPQRLGMDAWITATLATLSTPAAGGKITFAIDYFAA